MAHSDPPVQVAELLKVSKRQGIGFDLAWRGALLKYRRAHDKRTRHEWIDILDELEWAFELTYTDAGDIPGAAGLIHLAALADDRDHQPDPVRSPPVFSFERGAERKVSTEAWDFANGRAKNVDAA